MKKFFLLGLISLFLFSLGTSYGFSQTAEDIVAKMIAAQGGKKKLASFKDSTISGTIQLTTMNLSGTISIRWKKPDKSRVDIDIMGFKIAQATDGKIAWMDNPQQGGLQDMPENDAKRFKRSALGDEALINPEKYGIKYTLKGKEKIDEKDYFILERSFGEEEKKTAIYVDPDTYLVYKTKSKSPGPGGAGEVDRETFPSDYKKVAGTMVAHSSKVIMGGQEYMQFTFDKVTYDSGLEDSLFEKPTPPPPPPPADKAADKDK